MNAPIEAFGNVSETFFNGITPDQMLAPVHLTFRFIGLTPVSSFFCCDVMKNPTIPEDIERYKEHLRHCFPLKQYTSYPKEHFQNFEYRHIH